MSQQLISHNYYYGSEAEQYTFYRFPKALFTNDLYKNLSDGAKILYGLMLDRMGLSLKNGWVDEENRVFIYFTLEHLQEYMNCGHNKGVKLMSELEKIGLIERVKQGLGKPAIIYVKQFSVGSENPVKPPSDGSYQQSYQQNYSQGNPDFRKGELQTSDYGKSRLPHMGTPDFPKEEANKNNLNKPDFNNNNFSKNYPIQSYGQSSEQASRSSPHGLDKDVMWEINSYRDLIMDNIEYDCLIHRHGRERMDELVNLITDTVCSKRDYITIAGDDFPREVVKSRFLKLDDNHIGYVFDCIDKNTTKVRNVRKYLLAALYNAPTTMDTFYQVEVNHDLYGNIGT
ncbi:DUF6017 domain-containing protein [Alkalibaculum bacchi]|uniref:DUF6017 domain-containing protein n=1 Tax=Alkalibaculum bacchi TaxID=645887 RepID=UPI0026E91D27|nr:DUF6017 domain-containing protein [Alkalibaculum bacchi]